MGLLGVYRRSIANFSKIAKPLYDLLNWDKKLEKAEKTSNVTMGMFIWGRARG
jgi:hypothetical protein